MKTRFLETTQGIGNGFNHGKFMLAIFDEEEWRRRSELVQQLHKDIPRSADFWVSRQSLLSRCGWTDSHVLIFDLQTGEGALFFPGGSALVDLGKRRIWVCPMFEPTLEWLYGFVREHGDTWFEELPLLIELPEAPAATAGYRRGGNGEAEGRTYRTKTGRLLTDADIEALADEAEQGYDVDRLSKRE